MGTSNTKFNNSIIGGYSKENKRKERFNKLFNIKDADKDGLISVAALMNDGFDVGKAFKVKEGEDKIINYAEFISKVIKLDIYLPSEDWLN